MNLKCCMTITCRYGDRCTICKRVGDVTRIDMESPYGTFLSLFICKKCQEKGGTIKFEINVVDKEKGKEAKNRIKISRKLEKQLADDIGGKVQPGSGCTRLAGYKADVRRIGSWRLEHKFTDSMKSYMLKLVDLARVVKMAIKASELPALILNFRKINESFAIIPYLTFLEMTYELEEYQRLTKRR